MKLHEHPSPEVPTSRRATIRTLHGQLIATGTIILGDSDPEFCHDERFSAQDIGEHRIVEAVVEEQIYLLADFRLCRESAPPGHFHFRVLAQMELEG